MSSLQAQIEMRGERIFDLVDRHPESIFSKAGFYQRMILALPRKHSRPAQKKRPPSWRALYEIERD